MLDELPKGSILNLVYVVKPQQRIRKHLERLEKTQRAARLKHALRVKKLPMHGCKLRAATNSTPIP